MQPLSRGGRNRQHSRTPRRCSRRYCIAFVTLCTLHGSSVLHFIAMFWLVLWDVMPRTCRSVPTFEMDLPHPFFTASTHQPSDLTFIFSYFTHTINTKVCSQKVFFWSSVKQIHQNMYEIQAVDRYEVCISYRVYIFFFTVTHFF